MIALGDNQDQIRDAHEAILAGESQRSPPCCWENPEILCLPVS